MMLRRAARLLFRAAGWLLTPLVLLVAAAVGATIGLVVAPRFAPDTALIVTLCLALLAAVTGLMLWLRALRDNPELRATFSMTGEGVPESVLVDHLIHPEDVPPDHTP